MNGVTQSAIESLENSVRRLVAVSSRCSDDLTKSEKERAKLSDQLDDALDEIASLRLQVRERDQLIEELRSPAALAVSR